MLESIGASSVAELFEQIPADLHMRGRLDLPKPMSEIELRRHFAELAAANSAYPCFLGAGIYDHYIPSTVPAIIGPRGVLHFVYALSGRDQPGHAAADIRVSDADLRPDRDGGLQRLAL